MLDDGGDFADGVIAHEGRALGADCLVSFDKQAANLLPPRGEQFLADQCASPNCAWRPVWLCSGRFFCTLARCDCKAVMIYDQKASGVSVNSRQSDSVAPSGSW